MNMWLGGSSRKKDLRPSRFKPAGGLSTYERDRSLFRARVRINSVVYSVHKEKNASIGIKHIISFQGRESGEISALSSFFRYSK